MSLSDSRLGQSPVRLIGINAPFEPKLQFGREFGAQTNKRENVAAAWGFSHNGRSQDTSASSNSIKQPLAPREQTALSYQLSPHLQQQLRGGIKPLQNQGRSAYSQRPIELQSVHLGQAISASSRLGDSHTTTTVPNPRGGLYLRQVKRDFSW